ncbi:enoyl-CoA hydratase/isomerase family protein, partial [Shewanella sp.]|uniref:enoyl-CoA hydratase/isomerase family protein n=1 Tax=Shewanella sp. TaxID=50422 RepID=UPI003F38B800
MTNVIDNDVVEHVTNSVANQVTTTQNVVFQTLATASGKWVGIVTLNVEKALNALDLEMVRAMTAQLNLWKKDSLIACIVLDGSGEKAFCAGGDVRAL